jgi:hypothetical protein
MRRQVIRLHGGNGLECFAGSSCRRLVGFGVGAVELFFPAVGHRFGLGRVGRLLGDFRGEFEVLEGGYNVYDNKYNVAVEWEADYLPSSLGVLFIELMMSCHVPLTIDEYSGLRGTLSEKAGKKKLKQWEMNELIENQLIV